MKSVKIFLKSVNDVKKLVNILSKFGCDFDLANGRYTVDAKSILGIFSLDLSKPLRLDIYSDESEAETIISELSEFIN